MNDTKLNADNCLPLLPPLPPQVAASRVPCWQIEHLVHRTCPVCDRDAAEGVCRRPDRLIVSRCTGCQMIYLPDVPRDEDLQAFYRDYGTYKGLAPSRPSWPKKHFLWWTDPHISILENTGGLARMHVCEIGCSFGRFLQMARARGAKVHGVELDQRAAAFLRSVRISVSDTLDASHNFDIVYASHLMEHLHAPGELIRRVASVLPEDGRLLLALPNGGDADRSGPYWVGYRVDLEHLNYFSMLSLSRLLSQYGLFPEQFWEYAQPTIQRRHESSLGCRPSCLRRLAQLLAKWANDPFDGNGSFGLTVLARKHSMCREK